jgi:heat-inducible transcriptional repressor
MELTKRQTELFKIIVEEYIRTVQPISSKEIIENFFKDYSSATIRNEMVILEKNGLLEKTHTSSGRVPSLAGYKYYEKNILSPLITTDIETKLKNIFNARDLSIDSIIDQSVAIINEAIKLPIVVTKSDGEAILKRFDLIQIANDTALILIVTSNGNITKNTFKVNNPKQLDDISTCVRVLNDRLIDTPLSEVPSKLDAIQGIIRKSVHEYESCIRQIIEKIFDIKKINSVTSVSGTHYLTAQPEFREIDKLNQVLEFLENSNV